MDDPPYLTVGTEVSAKYKGAFCEAKIRKVVRVVKCRVAFKSGLGSALVSDDLVKGTLRLGATVEAKHPDKSGYFEATIAKIQDCSQYTVVFDDGDITTLRRSALCLKSGRHFNESETLDQLPLTHPEHFSNPVVGSGSGRRGGGAAGKRGTSTAAASVGESSDEEQIVSPSKKSKATTKGGMVDVGFGKVVCVDVSDKKKGGSRDSWFPALVVSPAAQETVKIKVKDEALVRSFKDGRYYTVPKKEIAEFVKEHEGRLDSSSSSGLRTAVDKAVLYLEKDELPPHWDRDALFGSLEGIAGSENSDDSSEEVQREKKDNFVAQLYKFMEERGSPIIKTPTVCNKDLDLHRLYSVVVDSGGYLKVSNGGQWKNITARLGFGMMPSTSTINLVKQAYKKYLLHFEELNKKLGYNIHALALSSSKPRNSRSVYRSVPSIAKKDTVEESPSEKQETESVASIDSDVASKKSDSIDEGILFGRRSRSRQDSKTNKEEETPPEKEVKKSSRSKSRKKENKTETPVPPEAAVEVAPIEPPSPAPSSQGSKKSARSLSSRGSKAKSKEVEDLTTAPVPPVGSALLDESQVVIPGAVGKEVPISVGDKLSVFYKKGDKNVTYEAKVVDVEEARDKFLVHYLGWNTRYDEWIFRGRIAENLSLREGSYLSKSQGKGPDHESSKGSKDKGTKEVGGGTVGVASATAAAAGGKRGRSPATRSKSVTATAAAAAAAAAAAKRPSIEQQETKSKKKRIYKKGKDAAEQQAEAEELDKKPKTEPVDEDVKKEVGADVNPTEDKKGDIYEFEDESVETEPKKLKMFSPRSPEKKEEPLGAKTVGAAINSPTPLIAVPAVVAAATPTVSTTTTTASPEKVSKPKPELPPALTTTILSIPTPPQQLSIAAVVRPKAHGKSAPKGSRSTSSSPGRASTGKPLTQTIAAVIPPQQQHPTVSLHQLSIPTPTGAHHFPSHGHSAMPQPPAVLTAPLPPPLTLTPAPKPAIVSPPAGPPILIPMQKPVAISSGMSVPVPLRIVEIPVAGAAAGAPPPALSSSSCTPHLAPHAALPLLQGPSAATTSPQKAKKPRRPSPPKPKPTKPVPPVVILPMDERKARKRSRGESPSKSLTPAPPSKVTKPEPTLHGHPLPAAAAVVTAPPPSLPTVPAITIPPLLATPSLTAISKINETISSLMLKTPAPTETEKIKAAAQAQRTPPKQLLHPTTTITITTPSSLSSNSSNEANKGDGQKGIGSAHHPSPKPNEKNKFESKTVSGGGGAAADRPITPTFLQSLKSSEVIEPEEEEVKPPTYTLSAKVLIKQDPESCNSLLCEEEIPGSPTVESKLEDFVEEEEVEVEEKRAPPPPPTNPQPPYLETPSSRPTLLPKKIGSSAERNPSTLALHDTCSPPSSPDSAGFSTETGSPHVDLELGRLSPPGGSTDGEDDSGGDRGGRSPYASTKRSRPFSSSPSKRRRFIKKKSPPPDSDNYARQFGYRGIRSSSGRRIASSLDVHDVIKGPPPPPVNLTKRPVSEQFNHLYANLEGVTDPEERIALAAKALQDIRDKYLEIRARAQARDRRERKRKRRLREKATAERQAKVEATKPTHPAAAVSSIVTTAS